MVAVRSTIAVLTLAQLSLSACSTQQIAHFEGKVGAMRCAKFGGLAEGSPEHQQCVADYRAAADQERADTQAGLLLALGAGTQVWSAEQQGRANAVAAHNSTKIYELRADVLDTDWNHTCRYADGTVVSSGKNRCPPSITGR